MAPAAPTIPEEIARYLRTGERDPLSFAWPGGPGEGGSLARRDLRGALIAEVRRRARGRRQMRLPTTDTVALTRGKVEPMVRGLFPRAEQEAVLALLERSVVFVTGESVEAVLWDAFDEPTAWTVANLYLRSVGARLLAKDAPRIVGLSVETTCYVTPECLQAEDRFADYIVHEAAHVFHNHKRARLGLRATRTKEWLLEIDFRQREPFAYACEAYARVCALAQSAAERRALAAEYGRTTRVALPPADRSWTAAMVAAAASARNGWKVILAQCAPK